MKQFTIDKNWSMYDAARQNISASNVKYAVSFYGKKYTFGKIFRLIDVLAENLKEKYRLGKGDTLTLCMPNSPSALIAFYAANKLGAAVNLVHPYIPPEKLKESAEKTKSKLVVVYDAYPHKNRPEFSVALLESDCGYFMGAAAKTYYRLTKKKLGWGEKLEKLLKGGKKTFSPPAKFGFDEPAVYLASGGTTGEPKIIMHNNYTFNLLCSKAPEFLRYDLDEYTSLYNVLPIFHGFGLCINMHMCMMMRRTNIMCIKFDAKRSAKQIVKEKANILTGVPTMFLKLLGEKNFVNGDLSYIKDVFVGGDSVSAKLIDDFNAVLKRQGSKAELYEGYGLTETVTVCVVNSAVHHKKGSLGYPLSGTRLAVAKDGKFLPCGEVGEIYIDSEQFMLGYMTGGNPFEEINGVRWLKTGDYGWLDEDGFLYFKQRIKNMIKVSGVPVYPSEIEGAAMKVAGVKKACAIGISDSVRGQHVRLYVEIAGDAEAVKAKILSVCREQLIAYAVPREIVVKERLPVNLIGKIDRKVLEEEAAKE